MAALQVRRADFLMALAYATDLATGHSRDFALRSCVLGMRFADVAGLDQDTRRRIYHQALLRYIGCNADTHLLAAAWGDEITLRRELHHIDMGTGRTSSKSLSEPSRENTLMVRLRSPRCLPTCCRCETTDISTRPTAATTEDDGGAHDMEALSQT